MTSACSLQCAQRSLSAYQLDIDYAKTYFAKIVLVKVAKLVFSTHHSEHLTSDYPRNIFQWPVKS